MDKKKVKELIEEAKHLAILRKYENRLTYLNNCICCLKEALEELSKSDWVSVADELPPYEEDVLVCNKNEPDEIWFSHRTKESWVETDKNGFTKPLNCFPITHFRKIDKLED